MSFLSSNTITVEMFSKDGSSQEVEISNIYPEDAAFFTENGIEVSMEDVHGNMIVYGDYGGEEEMKAISFQGQKSCEETLHELRTRIEGHLNMTTG